MKEISQSGITFLMTHEKTLCTLTTPKPFENRKKGQSGSGSGSDVSTKDKW